MERDVDDAGSAREGAMNVLRHPDGEAFLAAAEPWLLEAEEENNLLLGLARSLTHSTEGYGSPAYLATVEAGGSVVGCAFRTPPFKLGLTRMPHAAVTPLAEDVARVYPTIPAVLAPNELALAFGETWAGLHPVRAVPAMRQRIYVAREVRLPPRMAPGFMRPAVAADLPTVVRWLDYFFGDTGVEGTPPEVLARQLVGRSALAVWMDGEPVSMAGFSGSTPNTIRVSYVYTPEPHRGRGYASALVGHLSRFLLETRYRSCVLYTDLSNPTSNAIYQRLGYRPLCDVMDVELRPDP